MTRDKVKIALDCCINGVQCENCPYKEVDNCFDNLITDACYYINKNSEYAAEIEKLNGELIIETTRRKIAVKAYHDAKSEAIKEFAEKLKSNFVRYDRYDNIYAHHIIDDIDFLLEEMLEYKPNMEHQCGYKHISELKNKCGSCVYAVPSTFGNGTCYVECTNQEHIAKYCKRPISRIRQRTAPACRSYEDKTEKGGDNDA